MPGTLERCRGSLGGPLRPPQLLILHRHDRVPIRRFAFEGLDALLAPLEHAAEVLDFLRLEAERALFERVGVRRLAVRRRPRFVLRLKARDLSHQPVLRRLERRNPRRCLPRALLLLHELRVPRLLILRVADLHRADERAEALGFLQQLEEAAAAGRARCVGGGSRRLLLLLPVVVGIGLGV